MDSLTHFVLGAALGEVTLGKKLGYKAAIVGAIAETVPDFDVFLNFLTNDEILKLQIHRSYSHAWLSEFLLAFPLAWLTHLIFKRKIPYKQWLLLWVLGLMTHSLLDCCTTYGTQLLLPFTHTLVGFNNISVVDAFFTLPFMAFVIACFFMRKENRMRLMTAWMGLGYALVYLACTLVNKYEVHQHFAQELERQNIRSVELYTSPTLFNNFLWSGIAMRDDTLWLAEYSILQGRDEVKWAAFARNTQLVKNHPDQHAMEVLEWFSQGKYFALQSGDTLRFFNVKWGRGDFRQTEAEKAMPFDYEVYPGKNGWDVSVRQPHFAKGEFGKAFGALWRRMFTADNW